MKKMIFTAVAGILSAVLFSGCTAINPVRATSAGIKALQALSVTDAQVSNYSAQYVRQLDAQNTIAGPDDPYTQRIERLTRSFNGADGINIKVYKTSDANAFATADGSVRVYSGLMDIMTDEELLGVIGHEIGHYINHDSRDAFRNALLTSAVREGVASTGGIAAALSASQVGDIAQSLSQSQYSQKQESDADLYGYRFLKEHGINPWAMSMAFDKLLQMERQAGTARTAGLSQLFSTHPDLEARSRRMAQMARNDGYKKPVNGASSLHGTTVTGSRTSEQWHF